MSFKVITKSSNTKARLGLLTTNHGVIKTPAFFPVATQAALKGLVPKDLDEIGISGLLVNAYHLSLRPGIEVIERMGGLHKFMGFYGPIITDSGGYQVFSLARLRKIKDSGVEFQSHIDGSLKFFSPAEVLKIQLSLGSDIVVPLDECIKLPAEKDQAFVATKRTIHWAKISKEIFDREKKDGTLFLGIIQGATYFDLRDWCLEELLKLDVDGIAIGGLSVGESLNERYKIISFIDNKLDKNYLRYFMGYGKPEDILEAVGCGMDIFDCVVPTRFARTGTTFTNQGKIVIRNAIFSNDSRPLDEACSCYVCKNFSRAYLRHLINSKEVIGAQLLTYHNIWWYNRFIDQMQEAIKQDRFAEFKEEFLSQFKEDADENSKS